MEATAPHGLKEASLHQFVGLGLCLMLLGSVGTVVAQPDGCGLAATEQETARTTTLREAEAYAACLARNLPEEPCTREFDRLRSAHIDLGSATWSRLRECG